MICVGGPYSGRRVEFADAEKRHRMYMPSPPRLSDLVPFWNERHDPKNINIPSREIEAYDFRRVVLRWDFGELTCWALVHASVTDPDQINRAVLMMVLADAVIATIKLKGGGA